MPHDIGKTLKKCRNDANMSVKTISDLLTKKGFKASESTIYSWENGNSQPTPGAMLTMCEAYHVDDILATFGYDGYNEDGTLRLDMYEIDMIEKYRFISEHSPAGAETVDYILNREYNVANQLKGDRLTIAQQERSSSSTVQHKDASAYEAERISKLLDDEEKEDASALSNF